MLGQRRWGADASRAAVFIVCTHLDHIGPERVEAAGIERISAERLQLLSVNWVILSIQPWADFSHPALQVNNLLH